MCWPRVGEANRLFSVYFALLRSTALAIIYNVVGRQRNLGLAKCQHKYYNSVLFKNIRKKTCIWKYNTLNTTDIIHRHSNSGPPIFVIWSLPRLWYGSLSGSISLNHLSIFYNISCYNSLVLLTCVSKSSCRITYIYIKVWNNRQNIKRESSLRLDILQ